MTSAILRTTFKIKKLKVRVTGRLSYATGRLTQTHNMCHIFRTVSLKDFKVGVWVEDVDRISSKRHDLRC